MKYLIIFLMFFTFAAATGLTLWAAKTYGPQIESPGK
jgi:hypothetical protein